jgi:hypothetical protein
MRLHTETTGFETSVAPTATASFQLSPENLDSSGNDAIDDYAAELTDQLVQDFAIDGVSDFTAEALELYATNVSFAANTFGFVRLALNAVCSMAAPIATARRRPDERPQKSPGNGTKQGCKSVCRRTTGHSHRAGASAKDGRTKRPREKGKESIGIG